VGQQHSLFLIADKVEDLQEMLGIVGECSIKSIGLNINTKKTKFMIITGKTQEFPNASLTYENQPIERGCVKTGNPTQK